MNALVPSTVAPEATVQADPFRCIARSWSGSSLHLGLEQPFRLLGGDSLGPDRLPLSLALDWAPELQRAVIDGCMSQSAAERPWFTLQPLALVGPCGVGRTLMARRLARCAGVPFATIDVSESRGLLRLQHVRRAPDLPAVSDAVIAMATSRCANPVILLTGLDKAGEETIEVVQRLTDPASSSRWIEQDLEAMVDLSQVTWLIQTNTPLGLSRSLSHVRPVQVRIEIVKDRELRSLTILSELLDDHGLDHRSLGCSVSALLDHIHNARSSTAFEGYKAGEQALAAVSRNHR